MLMTLKNLNSISSEHRSFASKNNFVSYSSTEYFVSLYEFENDKIRINKFKMHP